MPPRIAHLLPLRGSPARRGRAFVVLISFSTEQAFTSANTSVRAAPTAWGNVWRVAYRNADGKQQTAVIGPYPLIGLKEARDRRDITRDSLMDALRPMDAAGLSVYVRRVRMWASQVLDWGVQHGHCAENPASSINAKVAFSRKPREGFAALGISEVHPFLERLALEDEFSPCWPASCSHSHGPARTSCAA